MATNHKKKAAERAVEFLQSGMVIGLGSGSTAAYAIQRIGERIKNGELTEILGIPTSVEVQRTAEKLGIPLTTLEEQPSIQITIDGADEVDPDFNLIKGGGGALLREKIVAQASQREIIVIEESKLSPTLGTKWPVPVEVVSFGWQSQAAYLESLGAKPALRRDEEGNLFRTDEDNLILDCNFGPIADLQGLATTLKRRAGIVEHGLFLGLASDLIVAGPNGVRHLQAGQSPRKES